MTKKTRKLTKREIESVKGGLSSVYRLDPDGTKGDDGTGKGDLPPY